MILKVETFELTDNTKEVPNWVQLCIDAPDTMVTVTPITVGWRTLADELVSVGIYKSKTEVRNAVKNRGLAVCCFEGAGNPYASIGGIILSGIMDKVAIVDDANVPWILVDGDVIKTGKRKFYVIREKSRG